MKFSHIAFLILLFTLFNISFSYTNPSSCTSNNQYYNMISLDCTTCPSNTERGKDFTYCNCTNSFYSNPDIIGFNSNTSPCISITTYNKATEIISIYNKNGLKSPQKITCSANSYPNYFNNKCIPCSSGMTYSLTLSTCICGSNLYAFNGFCYSASGFVQTISDSNPSDHLIEQHAKIGCNQYGFIQSCNIVINRCVSVNYLITDFFCSYINTNLITKTQENGMPTYKFSSAITDSINIYASSIKGTNSSNIRNTLTLILVQYNVDGTINDIKPLDNSIFACTMSAQDIVSFMSYKSEFVRKCTSNRIYKTTYLYQIYVYNLNGTLAQIPIKIGDNYYKRFMPKNYNSISIILNSVPPLQVPTINIYNNTSPQIRNSSVGIASINFIAFFAVFMVMTFAIFILNFYRYMKYNPDQTNDPYYCFKGIALGFIYMIRYMSIGIHLFLLCLSTYAFCFFKFQQTVFLILPTEKSFTDFFDGLFYSDFCLVFIAIFIFLFNLVNSVDIFLIDWQKQKELGKFEMGKNRKEVSVWRKVMLVNQLYELTIHRNINIEMVTLFALLFLQGLDWINLNSMTPNTTDIINGQINSTHHLLSYFLITFVVITIALIQVLIRYALKTWIPLPVENFIDLCSVSNISIIFFDENLHGYYIHGMNPLGQSEGSLNYIQSMFEKQAKSFGKSRSFKIDDLDHCQTFQVIFPMQIRQAFLMKYKSRFNQKLAGKAYNTSVISNPIPDMLSEEDYKDLQEINNSMLQSFKYYLQGVKTSQFNIKERSLFEKMINCPIDIETMGKLPVFFKDQWYQFSNILLSGHDFFLLFNFINFVNIFYRATNNVFYAFFIAVIFQKIFTFIFSFFIKRNISKNTLIDDKFFN